MDSRKLLNNWLNTNLHSIFNHLKLYLKDVNDENFSQVLLHALDNYPTENLSFVTNQGDNIYFHLIQKYNIRDFLTTTFELFMDDNFIIENFSEYSELSIEDWIDHLKFIDNKDVLRFAARKLSAKFIGFGDFSTKDEKYCINHLSAMKVTPLIQKALSLYGLNKLCDEALEQFELINPS